MAFGSALGQRPSVSKYSAITAEYPVASGYSVNPGDVVDVVGGELTKSITKQDVSTVKIAGGLVDISIGGSYPQYNKIQKTAVVYTDGSSYVRVNSVDYSQTPYTLGTYITLDSSPSLEYSAVLICLIEAASDRNRYLVVWEDNNLINFAKVDLMSDGSLVKVGNQTNWEIELMPKAIVSENQFSPNSPSSYCYVFTDKEYFLVNVTGNNLTVAEHSYFENVSGDISISNVTATMIGSNNCMVAYLESDNNYRLTLSSFQRSGNTLTETSHAKVTSLSALNSVYIVPNPSTGGAYALGKGRSNANVYFYDITSTGVPTEYNVRSQLSGVGNFIRTNNAMVVFYNNNAYNVSFSGGQFKVNANIQVDATMPVGPSCATNGADKITLAYIKTGSASNSFAAVVETKADDIAGSFAVISSQAISLSTASAGENAEVILAGTVEAPWITQGQEITSPGVYGFGALDGLLNVRPYWDAPSSGGQ